LIAFAAAFARHCPYLPASLTLSALHFSAIVNAAAPDAESAAAKATINIRSICIQAVVITPPVRIGLVRSVKEA
jgi:hypothetical protein